MTGHLSRSVSAPADSEPVRCPILRPLGAANLRTEPTWSTTSLKSFCLADPSPRPLQAHSREPAVATLPASSPVRKIGSSPPRLDRLIDERDDALVASATHRRLRRRSEHPRTVRPKRHRQNTSRPRPRPPLAGRDVGDDAPNTSPPPISAASSMRRSSANRSSNFANAFAAAGCWRSTTCTGCRTTITCCRNCATRSTRSRKRAASIVVTSTRPAASLANLPPDVRSRFAAGLCCNWPRRATPHASESCSKPPPRSAGRCRTMPPTAWRRRHRHRQRVVRRRLSSSVRTRRQPREATPSSRPPAAPPDDPPAHAARNRRCRRQIYGVRKAVLKSASRRQSAVLARAMAVYLARELAGASYEQIGRALGGRDHTTIMHNYRKIDRERQRRHCQRRKPSKTSAASCSAAD